AGDAAGYTAAMGDLTGDGALDIVLSAPAEDTAGTTAGAVYGLAGAPWGGGSGRVGVAPEQFLQRPPLDIPSTGGQTGVACGERQRGRPGGVDQGKGDALQDHRQVVRVLEVAEGAGVDAGQARNDDHPGVPPAPERADHPPAQRLTAQRDGEHGRGELGDERP